MGYSISKASIGVLRVLLIPTWTPDHGVVHRTLALRGYPLWGEAGERGEHGVGDAVGGLDVPGHDRSRVGRVDQAPPGGLYGERGVGAGVGEYVLGEQYAQGEVACGAGDGERAVYVAADGIGGAREVYPHRVALDGHGGPYADIFVRDAVALHAILCGVLAIGEFTDSLTGAFLGVGDHLLESGEDGLFAAAFYQLP